MDGYNVLLICGSIVVSQMLSLSNTLLPYFYKGEYSRNKRVEDVVKKLEDNIQVKLEQTENSLKSEMKNIKDKMEAIQEQHKVVLANCKTTSVGEYKTLLGYTDSNLELTKKMTNKVGDTISEVFAKYLEDIGNRADGVNKEEAVIKFQPKKRKFVAKNEHTRDWSSNKQNPVTSEMKQEIDEYINTKNEKTQGVDDKTYS